MPTMLSGTEAAGTGSIPPGFIRNPVQFFDRDVPEGFLRDVVEMLFVHYGARNKCLKQFGVQERHDLWPQYRRAMIERDFRDLAQRHGLNAVADLNVSLNAFHSVVRCGLIVLTQSYVSDRDYMPRPAEFRRTLTRTCQGNLFPALEEKPPLEGSVYLILTHGVFGEDEIQPGFADILIPAVEGEKIIVFDRIKLFEERFPDFVATLRTRDLPDDVATEQIKDEAKPKFRSGEEFGG